MRYNERLCYLRDPFPVISVDTSDQGCHSLDMNSSELKRLTTLIEEGTVPQWLQNELERRRDEIEAALNRNQEVILKGPQGEQVIIRPDKTGAAA